MNIWIVFIDIIAPFIFIIIELKQMEDKIAKIFFLGVFLANGID